MDGKVTLALKVLMFTLGAVLFITQFSTLVTWVPYLSSIMSYATLAHAKLFAPCAIAILTITLLLFFFHRRTKWFLWAAALDIASIFIALVMIEAITGVAQLNGVKISYFGPDAIARVEGISEDDYVYAGGRDEDLLITVFSDDQLAAEDGAAMPIALYVHGGGWVEGDRHWQLFQCRKLADAGFIAAAIDYDVSTPEYHGAAGLETEMQVRRAIGWLRDHASEFGGDPTRIALMGDSAGGNIALDVAFKINAGDDLDPEGRQLPRISALSVIYPVADPADFHENDDLVFSSAAHYMTETYTGGTPEGLPEVYASVTPANFATPDAPATFIMVGEHDALVPPQPTYDLASLLERLGVECKLVRIPYENHSMDYPPGNVASQIYAELTIEWLQQHMM